MAHFDSIVPDSGVLHSRGDEWLAAIQPLHQQTGSVQADAAVGDFGMSFHNLFLRLVKRVLLCASARRVLKVL